MQIRSDPEISCIKASVRPRAARVERLPGRLQLTNRDIAPLTTLPPARLDSRVDYARLNILHYRYDNVAQLGSYHRCGVTAIRRSASGGVSASRTKARVDHIVQQRYRGLD